MTDEAGSIFNSSPPPHVDDILFGPNSEDWHLNACITHWGEVDYAYKAGFRRAALQLTTQMCEQPIDQDSVVYPIVYLYRHHVELVLKDIFRLAADLCEVPLSGSQKDHLGRHDLGKLWSLIRPLLDPACRIGGESCLPVADLDGIDAYMRQVNDHDPRGESFRYARSRDSTRTLSPELVHINIRSFAIHMEKLADYLGGLENWLGMLVDSRNEAMRR
ncbi:MULTISPECIES: hypothetical protein [Agrobacterium]|uniref:Uncharacterized protein n=1 Tax=Agrobacterium tumefaciens TaxID=358 RepID=A0AAE6BGC0_AGRTU|nr:MULTISPECIES: hypothetical protein [Agrobacterium]QCL76870.1 hypothetical protein CFBP5499_25645 [Agrobacterium tumefaciens]QCL82376.1 hypothetical protein CFBP5877_24895 [Agrobacterium tumefaciens]CUX70554.1 conserved hypothetical protein [Agrobacterium sp. NCPPB 925]